MIHLPLLIKPASGNCDLRCKYCFYRDEAQNRAVESYGMMSADTHRQLLSRAFDYADELTLAYQGGEPTLVGLDWFKQAVSDCKSMNKRGIPVHFAIQTNGMRIDDAWAEFFAGESFLVGLSIDGTRDTHDKNRVDGKDRGSYATVSKAARILQAHNVELNILTVVNAVTARHAKQIYDSFKKSGHNWLQFIPCLNPLGETNKKYPFSLTPDLYGEFLCRLFDCWYDDIMKGDYISIRWFDNLVMMLRGMMPECCGMAGVCSEQNVIEANGDVYPCDFYVLDEYKIGNVFEHSFEQIGKMRKNSDFIRASEAVHEKCRGCDWYVLCRGGCKRHRDGTEDGLCYFCESYDRFFRYSIERLLRLK